MKKTIYIVLFLVFLFSSLNLTIELQTKAIYIVYGLLCALFLVPLVSIEKKIRINVPTFITMILFFFFSGLSSVFNGDARLMISSLLIFILYLVSCVILPMLKIEINSIVFNAVLVSHFLLILIPLIINNGIGTVPYRGIFYNTNSFGTVAATIFVLLLSRFLVYIENIIKGLETLKSNFKNFYFLINIALLIFSFYLIIISGSRTSFLSGVISIIVGVTYLIIYLFKYKKIGNLIIKGGFISFILSVFLFLIIKITSIDEAIFNNIIYKFTLRSSQSSGVLSARDDIWARTIDEASLIGNGNDYFTEMGIGAHNTFISILGQYGWLALISFIMLLVLIFYYATKFSLSSTNNKYKYLPLMILIGFLAMSMGEDMTFKASMIIMFFSFGEAIRKVSQ